MKLREEGLDGSNFPKVVSKWEIKHSSLGMGIFPKRGIRIKIWIKKIWEEFCYHKISLRNFLNLSEGKICDSKAKANNLKCYWVIAPDGYTKRQQES